MAPIPDENTDEPKRECSKISDMETPPVNITVETDSSGSDEETIGPAQLGYQPLSQDPHGQADFLQGDDDDDATTPTIDHVIAQSLNQHDYPALPNTDWEAGPDAELKERKDVWNKERPTAPAMTKDEAEHIKSAMSSFSLPMCAQPDWARAVSEDEWKRRLYARLNIPSSSSQSAATSSQPADTPQLTDAKTQGSHVTSFHSTSRDGDAATLQTDPTSSTAKSLINPGTLSRDGSQSSQTKTSSESESKTSEQSEPQSASQEVCDTKVLETS